MSGFTHVTGRLIDAMLGTFWAMEEHTLTNLAQVVVRHSAGIRLGEEAIARIVETRSAGPSEGGGGNGSDRGYRRDGSVAVIPVGGVIAKHASSVNGSSQPRGTSTEAIRSALAAARGDEHVSSILLHIESPGGSIDGVETLAKEIYAAQAGGGKPVWAFFDDLGASAAYWIGSQAGHVVTNPTGQVGSIGVYCVLPDTSRLYENEGVKVNLIRSASGKGIGVRGVAVTTDQIAKLQRRVDVSGQHFVNAIARGRGIALEQAAALATGDVWSGQEALDNGIVDAMCDSAEEVVAQMNAKYGAASPGGGGRTVGGGRRGVGGGFEVLSAVVARPPGVERAPAVAGGVEVVIEAGGPGARVAAAMDGATVGVDASGQGAGAGTSAGSQDMRFFKNGIRMDPGTAGNAANAAGGGGGGGGDGGAPVTAAAPGAEATTAGVGNPLAAERARVKEINTRASRHIGIAAIAALATACIEDGTSADQFSAKALDLLGDNKPAVGRSSIEVGPSSREKARTGLQLMLLSRMNPGLMSALDDTSTDAKRAMAGRIARAIGYENPNDAIKAHAQAMANGLRGVSLKEMATTAIAARPDLNLSYEQVRARFGDGPEFMAAAFHSTSDFPLLLAAAANKSLLAAFMEIDVVWPQIAARGIATDYKEMQLLSLSEAPKFELITEGKTPNEGSFNERKETVSVAPYGKRFSFTYQMLRNDDLDAFGRFNQLIGQSARRLPEDGLFALLALNAGLGPAMSDGNTLYHAAHNNVGPGAALSYISAQADWTTIRKQKGLGQDAAPLDIIPSRLLVPVDLQWAAEDIAKQPNIPSVTATPSNATQQNVLKGRFTPLASPRMTGTRRYWFADPAVTPVIIVKFLDGTETPEITVINDGDPMSQRFQATVRGFGISAAQPEGTYTDAGA